MHQVTLYPAGHCFSLREEVKGIEHAPQVEDMSELTARERRSALINSFGTKKRQASVRSSEANIIRGEAVVGGR
jgi:A49-like RNA polymerase I associated factor